MNIDFEKVLERADIQHLRSFLLIGKECEHLSFEPYKRRVDEPRRAVLKMIEKKFPDMDDNEPLNGKFLDATGAYMDVFMELGLQAGMKLAAQVLGSNEKAE